MLTKAIVRPPSANFLEGLTTADLGAPNYEHALAQHEAYCLALEQCGLTLIRLNADPSFPDSTFVEDTAIVTARGAIVTRPGAASRAGEAESMRQVLVDYFPSLQSIQAPGTVDGGDVCEAGDHFFIGISERTNEAGARQLGDILASFSYTTSFIDIRQRRGKQPVPGAVATGSPSQQIFHLKSGISYIGNQRLLAITALADRAEYSKYDLVRVADSEAYAANCVRINEHVLVAAGFPLFEANLRELGYQTIALEMSEFEKMDGGLSCLSLRF